MVINEGVKGIWDLKTMRTTNHCQRLQKNTRTVDVGNTVHKISWQIVKGLNPDTGCIFFTREMSVKLNLDHIALKAVQGACNKSETS